MNVSELIARAKKDGLFTNCVVGGLGLSGQEQICLEKFWTSNPALPSDAIFDIASITKFVTAVLYMHLRDNGLLRGVDDETYVKDVLPMKGEYVELLQVKHLLCFRALFNRGYPAKEAILQGLPAFRKDLLEGGLRNVPGSEYSYGNPHTIILGWLLEEVMGVSLYDLMNKYIFIPCGIGINSFPFQTFIQSEPDLPKGVINDPAARYAFDHGHLLGSAGLFMSAGHLLKIVKIMLGDSGFLKPETFEGLSRGEFPDFGRGLPIWSAFRKNLEHFAIDDPTGHHKLGHTGCILATFRGSGFGFVALTDYLFDNPRADNRHLLYQFFASLSGAVRFEMVGS